MTTIFLLYFIFLETTENYDDGACVSLLCIYASAAESANNILILNGQPSDKHYYAALYPLCNLLNYLLFQTQ